ncbi:LIC_13355 family lipoprotein [Leptospira idonii]|uniref:LIC_13355 family lipoprotein n=1 Tax=Leptospira idonii TaxID=1193500 RepID=A0A4R9LVU3_9LEPT|nr:LIC_13355 family lipoprotein [Leptospira idonii]TGN17314.1 LIC_13355 family lipoprotein [Leptospira idonii]
MQNSKKSLIILSTFLFFAAENCMEEKKNDSATLLPLLLLAGSNSSSVGPCPPTSLPSDIPVANTVVSASSTVSGFNDSKKAINGVCGGGEFSGSLDVYALNLTGAGASMVVSWGGKTVKPVTGVDFVVYENPFRISETSDRYAFDPMIAEVSRDNVNYCGFTLTHDNTSSTLNKISSWQGFGGLRPVLYNMATKIFTLEQLFTSTGDGFLTGGGDGFDLANLNASTPTTSGTCNGTLVTNIQTNGFLYLKMTSASAVNNPATSAPYVYPHSYDNGPDIDGVVAKQVE